MGVQLVIPQLVLCATPAHLFIARLRAEIDNQKFGSEVERMNQGRRWLDKKEKSGT